MPYDERFYLTVVCLIPSWLNKPTYVWFDHSSHLPTPKGAQIIQELVDECDIFSAQNLKYDLNVLRRQDSDEVLALSLLNLLFK